MKSSADAQDGYVRVIHMAPGTMYEGARMGGPGSPTHKFLRIEDDRSVCLTDGKVYDALRSHVGKPLKLPGETVDVIVVRWSRDQQQYVRDDEG